VWLKLSKADAPASRARALTADTNRQQLP
jgi:hypothetical protein